MVLAARSDLSRKRAIGRDDVVRQFHAQCSVVEALAHTRTRGFLRPDPSEPLRDLCRDVEMRRSAAAEAIDDPAPDAVQPVRRRVIELHDIHWMGKRTHAQSRCHAEPVILAKSPLPPACYHSAARRRTRRFRARRCSDSGIGQAAEPPLSGRDTLANSRKKLSLVACASSAISICLSAATAAAVWTTKAGSLRFPRFGTGAR